MSTVKVNTISTWTGSDVGIETGKTISGTASQFKMTDVVQGDVLYGSAADTLSRLAPGTSGQYLQTAGAAANPTWATVTGGLSAASQWRLTTSFTNDAEPIASNLEEADAPLGFGVLGSSMTQASGIFTFPSTGYWHITFQHNFHGNTNVYEKETHCKITTTTNNATYAVAADGVQSSGQNNPNNVRGSASTSYIFDVTDTANCKVRFDILVADSGTTTLGSTDYLRTGMTFIKLGDT
jgi:hypothetical protein